MAKTTRCGVLMAGFLREKGQILWDVTMDIGYVQSMNFLAPGSSDMFDANKAVDYLFRALCQPEFDREHTESLACRIWSVLKEAHVGNACELHAFKNLELAHYVGHLQDENDELRKLMGWLSSHEPQLRIMIKTYKRQDGEGLGANKLGEGSGENIPRATKNPPQKCFPS
jgi:hypothetical protein